MALVVIPLQQIPGTSRRSAEVRSRRVRHGGAWVDPSQSLDRRPVRLSAYRHGRVVAGADGRSVIHPTAAVYRRRRLVAAGLAAMVCAVFVATVWVVAGALGGGPLTAPEAPSAPAAIAATTVIVQPGDTLWSIARRLQPEGDVRGLVDQLAEVNGSASLRAGQSLVIDCCPR